MARAPSSPHRAKPQRIPPPPLLPSTPHLPVLLGAASPPPNPPLPSRSLSRPRSSPPLSSPPPPPLLVRAVATASALRLRPQRAHLLSLARPHLNLNIEVLSGADEARLVYLGILHFLPVLHCRVLAVDIGGGSTEFVLRFQGQILFSASLNLGHVTLTESFAGRFADLRSHVRTALQESGLAEKVRQLGFEIAVGSSGTVKSIEKAISGLDFRRKWRFGREELRSLEERICRSFEMLGFEGVRRLGFSKRKSEFIALREIFDALGIEEMDVSGYALGEGVVAEMMMKEKSRSDVEVGLDLNERWSSVVRLAVRFDCRNWMKVAVQCVGIAKDIFDGIRGCGVMGEDQTRSLVFLEDKDYEYLEASILLHNIGRVNGKKGYDKLSYQIIKHGGHLEGYSSEEVELIAQLVRFHRKKFPKSENASIQKLPLEMKDKFRVLCSIIRLSLTIQRCQHRTSQGVEVVHTPQGFKLVLGEIKEQCADPCGVQRSSATGEELRLELQHFEEVFHQKISIVIP
ncbi:uncharacterized protein A4U43_C07F26460 [Asparagus officinalis]|uniref:Uncharacterized protein n=1 Tax=Asparagus officinalis TaxID=4686 RepID=A0A5P1EF01_ASPOF|nr:uncharacterized protein LOC109847569 [Asparagus officinalis]ONK64475.1 uncharacterized protein A4U43_C07F26460 [Asparagus officinalis]